MAYLNESIVAIPTEVMDSFENGCCQKKLLPAGQMLYRVVTNDSPAKGITGTNFIEGSFWFDSATFNELASMVNYENNSPLTEMTLLTRNGLAVTTEFSKLADTLLCVNLDQPVWAWHGAAAKQTELLKNGMRWIYKGGLNQLWIPNLTPTMAKFRFYYSI